MQSLMKTGEIKCERMTKIRPRETIQRMKYEAGGTGDCSTLRFKTDPNSEEQCLILPIEKYKKKQ